MVNRMKKIKETFMNREFIIFLIIGCINTFNGTVISYLYSLIIPDVNVSFVCGYLTSLFIAYLLNTIFNFKEKLNLTKMIKFMISYIPNFIIQNAVVFLLYNVLSVHELISFAVAAVVGIPITFVLVKLFAFGKKD